MKYEEKDLVDLAAFIADNPKCENLSAEDIVRNWYSTKSAQTEALSVGNNEQAKELCSCGIGQCKGTDLDSDKYICDWPH